MFIQTEVSSLSMGPGSDPAGNVAAVIIALASLNENARDLLPGGIEALQSEFPDALGSSPGGGDILSQWVPALEGIQSDEAFPQPVREALRIFQRYYSIGK